MNENAAESKKKEIQLGFHISYYAREFGIDYGQKYYKDPLYRIEQDHKCAKALHERFGEYGLGNQAPEFTSIDIGIQPRDFINGALGGKMCYSSSEQVWTPEKPLNHIGLKEGIESSLVCFAAEKSRFENRAVYVADFRQIIFS